MLWSGKFGYVLPERRLETNVSDPVFNLKKFWLESMKKFFAERLSENPEPGPGREGAGQIGPAGSPAVICPPVICRSPAACGKAGPCRLCRSILGWVVWGISGRARLCLWGVGVCIGVFLCCVLCVLSIFGCCLGLCSMLRIVLKLGVLLCRLLPIVLFLVFLVVVGCCL